MRDFHISSNKRIWFICFLFISSSFLDLIDKNKDLNPGEQTFFLGEVDCKFYSYSSLNNPVKNYYIYHLIAAYLYTISLL